MKNDRVALFSLRAARHFSVGRKLAVRVSTPATAKLFRAGIYALSRLLLLATTLAYGSSAWSDEAFFQGKRITIFIGTQSGGSIVAARIISQYLGKYIPGNPSISVQPMLGGAHIVATNHVFNIAKPDGLTLLAANPNVAIAQLVKEEAVRFNVSKFAWIGSSGADGVVLTVHQDLPYHTFGQVQKADRELLVGTTAVGSNAYDFPLLLKEFAGAKFKLVSGYPANPDIVLAIERKEVEDKASLRHRFVPWFSGIVRPLIESRVPAPGLSTFRWMRRSAKIRLAKR